MEFKQLFWFRLSVFLLFGIAIVFGDGRTYKFRKVNEITEQPNINVSENYVQGVDTRHYTEDLRKELCQNAVHELTEEFNNLGELQLEIGEETGTSRVYELNEDQVVTEHVIAFYCPTTMESMDFWIAVKTGGETIEIIYETLS